MCIMNMYATCGNIQFVSILFHNAHLEADSYSKHSKYYICHVYHETRVNQGGLTGTSQPLNSDNSAYPQVFKYEFRKSHLGWTYNSLEQSTTTADQPLI